MSDFTEAAKGRFPLQTDYGSAASLEAPVGSLGKGVPRPDIPLWLLRILSCFPITGLLGFDHFYARSPVTGLLKFLVGCCIIPCVLIIVYQQPGQNFIIALTTFIGAILGCILFSLWYIWDAVQVTAEGDRVVHYGMSVPFDLLHGIAQGMVTDKETHYEASSSLLDILSRYFGWLFPAFSQFASGNSNGGVRLMIISGFGFIFAAMAAYYKSGAALFIGIFNWFFMVIAGIHWFLMRNGFKEKSFKGLQDLLNYYNLIKMYKNPEMDKAIEIKKVDFSAGKMYQPIRRVDYDDMNPSNPGEFDISNIPPIVALPVFLFRAIKAVISMTPMGAGFAAAQAQASVAAAAQAQAQAAAAAAAGKTQAQASAATGQAKAAAAAGQAQAQAATGILPPRPVNQTAGAREEGLSTESQILGATVFAIIGGGIMKAVVDNLV